MMFNTNCDECMNYDYDEEYEEYVCLADMDEDDMARLMSGRYKECPFYRPGDEYTIVRKQN